MRRRSGLVAVAVALTLLAACSGDHKTASDILGEQLGAPPVTSSTTAPETATTATTGGGPATTAKPLVPTSTPGCYNSTNPACGPFVWYPPPAPDQPIVVKLEASPPNPVVGQDVVFDVVATDGDAPIHMCNQPVFGDAPAVSCGSAISSCPARYGPWAPPARMPGKAEGEYHHTYSQAGTYRAEFTFDYAGTGRCNGPSSNPYADGQTVGAVTITVSATPPPPAGP